MRENIQRSTTRRAAASAFAALPPDLQRAIAANRIEAVRVEESGALCLRMANQAGLSEKSRRIEAVRATARAYGLDLQRLAFAQSLNSRFDDGTLLVCARGPGGRPRLFRADGSVDPQAWGATPSTSPPPIALVPPAPNAWNTLSPFGRYASSASAEYAGASAKLQRPRSRLPYDVSSLVARGGSVPRN